jgi:hypothetical protein
MDVHEKVRAESERFRAALPSLLKSRLKGRYVIFLNGQVVADFATMDEAHGEAVRRFGYDGGFVVTQVKPQRVIWITDAHRMFKL